MLGGQPSCIPQDMPGIAFMISYYNNSLKSPAPHHHHFAQENPNLSILSLLWSHSYATNPCKVRRRKPSNISTDI